MSYLFYFSLSVLPFGEREKFCLDTCGSIHAEFSAQEWERVSVLTEIWEMEGWRCRPWTPVQMALCREQLTKEGRPHKMELSSGGSGPIVVQVAPLGEIGMFGAVGKHLSGQIHGVEWRAR